MQTLFSELHPGAELKQAVGMKAAERISNKDSIILIDEADKLLIDDAEEPPKNCKACIGFTATIPSGKEGDVVQDRLKKFKIEIWNNFGYKNDGLNVDAEVASIVEFFQIAKHRAKLVFCSAGKVLKVTQQAVDKNFKIIQDCKDLARIRDMHGYCLIVTDESLMRGIDYRLQEREKCMEEDGIDLLVACSFSNTRAF